MSEPGGAITISDPSEILATLHDAVENDNKCPMPKCNRVFGQTYDGTLCAALSSCSFSRGQTVAQEKRQSCVVCNFCVNSDGEGTGHVGDKGKCKVCTEVYKLKPREARLANIPATYIGQVTKVFSALSDSIEQKNDYMKRADEVRQTEASEGQRAAAAAAKDQVAQKRGFKDRAHELEWREETMTAARSLSVPFTGADWNDYLAWQKEQDTVKKRKADDDAAEMAKKERDEAVRAAEKKAKDELDEAVRAAKVELDKAVRAAEKKAQEAAVTETAVKRTPRTQESKDAANRNRAECKDTLQSTHEQLTQMAQNMKFKAPTGMTMETKSTGVGEHRLDGKFTKDSFFKHMPGFLYKANKAYYNLASKYEEAEQHNEKLLNTLRSVLTKYYADKLVDQDKATLQKVVDARLQRLGL